MAGCCNNDKRRVAGRSCFSSNRISGKHHHRREETEAGHEESECDLPHVARLRLQSESGRPAQQRQQPAIAAAKPAWPTQNAEESSTKGAAHWNSALRTESEILYRKQRVSQRTRPLRSPHAGNSAHSAGGSPLRSPGTTTHRTPRSPSTNATAN